MNHLRCLQTEQLDEAIVADFVRWIDQGAIDPRDAPPSPDEANELAWEAKLLERKKWWSLLSVENPEVPEVKDQEWSNQPVDPFHSGEARRAWLAYRCRSRSAHFDSPAHLYSDRFTADS